MREVHQRPPRRRRGVQPDGRVQAASGRGHDGRAQGEEAEREIGLSRLRWSPPEPMSIDQHKKAIVL